MTETINRNTQRSIIFVIVMIVFIFLINVYVLLQNRMLKLGKEQLRYQVVVRKEAEQMLEEVNSHLEGLVKERTLELEQSIRDLQETQEELIESEKSVALSKVLVDISHYLNTPIGTSITLASFVGKEQEKLSSDLKANKLSKTSLAEFLYTFKTSCGQIHSNLNRMADIITLFKNMNFHNDIEHNVVFRIKELLEETVSLVCNRNLINTEKVELKCDQLLEVNSSKKVFALMIEQLLLNAFKHGIVNMEDGLVEVGVAEEESNIKIWVSDNGKGINKDRIDFIFEPFHVEDYKSSTGVGLGLTLVKKISG